MNLRDLAYLVALDDHRHFGRAAEASFVSQPTLSTQVRKLEEELGITLIERAPRRIMFTDAGKAILSHARAVLAEVDAIRDYARRSGDPEAGTIRLGIFPTLGPYLLPHVVPRLHKRFPRLELLLVEEKTDDVLEQLRDGKLDAGLLALPIEDARLHVETLFTEPFVLATPPTHALARRKHLSLSDLSEQSVLLLEDGHCLRQQALDVCELAGASERAGFRATSLETLRQMVAADVGVTLLPTLAIKPPVPQVKGLRLIPFDDPPPSRSIAMVWRRTSVQHGLLLKLAEAFRALPADLLDPRKGGQPAPRVA
ncbi:MAG TPA: DNA-binding transcriptional regulator OxyR [Xanthomonadaceae bacterium]|nr:DNA-binding transcriptional regulator OxyR [Xanthomonadaceae bacterium]